MAPQVLEVPQLPQTNLEGPNNNERPPSSTHTHRRTAPATPADEIENMSAREQPGASSARVEALVLQVLDKVEGLERAAAAQSALVEAVRGGLGDVQGRLDRMEALHDKVESIQDGLVDVQDNLNRLEAARPS